MASDDEHDDHDDEDREPGAEVAVPDAAPAPRRLVLVPAQPDQERPEVIPVARPGERVPVIPARFQRGNIRATFTAAVAVNWHRSRYHGLRLPAYLLAVIIWALAGLFRGAVAVITWAHVAEGREMEMDAADRRDTREWHRLSSANREVRKTRWIIIGVIAGIALIGGLLVYRLAPVWVRYAVAAPVVLILAMTGKPEGHKIVAPAVIPPQYEIPTPEIITRGLGSLGISKIDSVIKAGDRLNFVSDVMQSGPGWGVHVDLPYGVTSRNIIARREYLASGLRRPLSATWPEAVPGEHEGRLYLWIGFHDMAQMPSPKWPLLKAGTADLFSGVPFGTDPRQRPVSAPLFESNWLIGAAPGNGKTSAVRVLGCAAALDVRADLWVHELAGKGDLEPLAQVCQRYCSGLHDDAIGYAADSLRMLRAELERRARVFGALPKEAKPDGKVTPELAARGFRLKVCVIDEIQNLMLHPEHGGQAAEDAAYVIRLGRAYGIILVAATQRPDKDSLPTTVSGVVTVRFCLKVPDQVSNDMILGTGSYRAGYNASLFRHATDAGLGWLKGDADPQIVKTYYLDLPATAKVAARARALREKAGVLSGYALGLDEDEIASPRDVLGDVLEVMGSAPAMHWDVLAQRMAERWPARWANLTHTALSAQVRAFGVSSVGVSMDGQKDKGCRRAAVEEAIRRG